MSDRHVEDKDRRWRGMELALAVVDGLELRTGLLNWRLRYPKGRGRSEVAKVAAVLQIFTSISEAYDSKRAELDRAFALLHDRLIAGQKSGLADWVYHHMGVPLRDAMRERAMTRVDRQSGRMEEAIRATVFDDVRPGGRGAAHMGKVAAGDDPMRPRPTQRRF